MASRPTLPTGLSPSFQGPRERKRRERERSVSVGSGSASSHGKSGKPIYSRDYHLRIQRPKYSLAKSIVCIGAKIHQRYSPGITEERTRDHNLYREHSKLSNSSGKLREVSFISDPTHTQSLSTVVSSQNPSPRDFPSSQDFKTRYRKTQFPEVSPELDYDVTKNLDGCHELSLRLAEFEGELDDSFSFPISGAEFTGLPNIEEISER